jgi:uncharacterized protein (DUF1499 family)
MEAADRIRTLAALFASVLIHLPAFIFQSTAKSVPRIHDITTDTENPPEFNKILSLRPPDANPTNYAGEVVAEQQRLAYPDVQPRFAALSFGDAFNQSLAAAQSLDWEIVEANLAEGRIEATDTTVFFGFKDDIVIRLRGDSSSRVRLDIRSISRVGISDVGANANRIRQFYARLPSFSVN